MSNADDEFRNFLRGEGLDLKEIRGKIEEGKLADLSPIELMAAIITDIPLVEPDRAEKSWEIIQSISDNPTEKEYKRLFDQLDKISEEGRARVGRLLASVELVREYL